MKRFYSWIQFHRVHKQADVKEIEYRCGEVVLTLPLGHGLPQYQQQFPQYDRFLPHLAKYIPLGLAVIDVGANCGDTVAAMAQANSQLHYLCIEPDDTFLAYFRTNVDRLREAIPTVSVEVVQAIVGKTVVSASLAGERGTKHVQPDDHGQCTALLDNIYDITIRPTVGLLKSDVDGYDFDVLDSAPALVQKQEPVIFIECQYATVEQLEGFRGTIRRLFETGYLNWTVFDNFGEVVITRADFPVIDQLMTYVWRQNQGQSARTIYYFDLLACTSRHADWVARAVESY